MGSQDPKDQTRALSTAGAGAQQFHAPAVSTCKFRLCVPGVCLLCVWVISMCVTAPWVGLCVLLCLNPREHTGKPMVHPLGVCAK